MAKNLTLNKALIRRETRAGYLFMLPSLIFFIGFVVIPMVLCLITSFFDSTMGKDTVDVFIGLRNYAELIKDPIFIRAFKNPLLIVVVSVPIVCIFSLWVASVIYDLPMFATSAFRIIFYLPVVTGSVAVTVVWKWMYNNYYGIFNYLGQASGLLSENISGQEHSSLGNQYRFHTKMFKSDSQIEYFVSNNPTGRTLNYPLSAEMNICTSSNKKYYYIIWIIKN